MHAGTPLQRDEGSCHSRLKDAALLGSVHSFMHKFGRSRRFAGTQHECERLRHLLAPVTCHGYAFGVQESRVIPNVAQMHATPPGRAPFQAATGRALFNSLCRCRPIKGSFPSATLRRRLSPAPLKLSLPLCMVSLSWAMAALAFLGSCLGTSWAVHRLPMCAEAMSKTCECRHKCSSGNVCGRAFLWEHIYWRTSSDCKGACQQTLY